jgi:hypothetical protein
MKGVLFMILDVLGLGLFVAMCAPIAFPKETERLKEASREAAKLTKEQMAASAYTERGFLVKGYRSQAEARRHRSRLKKGTVVCLPDGQNITVEEGLKDVESGGWWYAWMSM